MFKSLFFTCIIVAIVLFKFDFYFKSTSVDGVISFQDGLMVILFSLVLFKLNDMFKAVFANSGPLGKFNYALITKTPIIIMVFIPFSNFYEFFTRVGIMSAIIIVPMYFICKKMIKLDKENYSIIDLLNTKILMKVENGLFVSAVMTGFILAVDYQYGTFKPILLGVFGYFIIMTAISFIVQFNLTRNFLVNGFTIFSLLIFLFFGFSNYQSEHKDTVIVYLSVAYLLLTIIDVISLFKYMINPEKFLKSRQVNTMAQMMLSIRPDSNIDYFKYFKNINLGHVFIQYDSFLGRVDCIIKGDYAILKEEKRTSTPTDKLFHVEHKEIGQHLFKDFFDLSHKFIDEYSNIDNYSILNLRTIMAYMATNSINYNELTDDDLKVLEMFQY